MEDGKLFHQMEGTTDEVETPYRKILALAPAPARGGVWIATEEGLIYGKIRTDDEGEKSPPHVTSRPFLINPKPVQGRACTLIIDKSDLVWILPQSGYLSYLDEASKLWRQMCYPQESVNVVAAGPVRGIWGVGHGRFDHLTYFDGIERQVWLKKSKPPGIPVSLLIEENGRAWLNTTDLGVSTTVLPEPSYGVENPSVEWHSFTTNDGLISNLTTAMVRGLDGRIYVASHGGINVFDPADGIETGRWSVLPGSDANIGDWISALTFAPPQAGGGLWVGYHNSTILRYYRDDHWTEFRLPACVLKLANRSHGPVQSVGALLVDDDGALWVGTVGGLLRWSDAGEGEPRWKIFGLDTIPMLNIHALLQDSQGRIWVGGDEGVAMWDGDQ
ncbi:MAG: two-component regulator propeller domain-containing protein [Chloroflexota bacterium]|nr:two-component regulator propeller domain-containing protein [Chloroflexota bacterium]